MAMPVRIPLILKTITQSKIQIRLKRTPSYLGDRTPSSLSKRTPLGQIPLHQVSSSPILSHPKKKSSTHAVNGKKFEHDVKNFIEAPKQLPMESWQSYISGLIESKTVLGCQLTKTSSGIGGHTEDIIIELEADLSLKLSCKKNNDFICHPRVRSFLKDPQYQSQYDLIKTDFNNDKNIKAHKYQYYEKLALLTEKLVTDPQYLIDRFKWLYPADVHIIHNDRASHYVKPNVPDPTHVRTQVVPGKGCGQNRSCNLHLDYDNGCSFVMRIHNAENLGKCVTNLDPFKWEVTFDSRTKLM